MEEKRLREMERQAAGEKVEGVREVTYDEANFCVNKEQFHRFVAELDKPVRDIPALRKLLTEPGVFDEK